MNHKVAYIQQQDGNWLNDNCFAAAYGFGRMGYTIQPFELTNAHELDIFEGCVVHGGIKGVSAALGSLDIVVPNSPSILKHLPDYVGRHSVEMTIGELADGYVKGLLNDPLFIKPLEDNKAFDGVVINNHLEFTNFNYLDDDYSVFVSEVVEFVTEYRCFVNRRAVVGAKNYTGDFTIAPNWDKVYKAVRDYDNQPVSYSLDFGVTNDGETLLIEINDCIGLGSYGLNPIVYCKLIRDRWNDLVKDKFNVERT